ncbi:glycoside hydrolase family 30 protein [Terribacillus saccharophilus]|uniref:glycoside hydrolase family 30 protein n=1 Tax=Terribacillus saccharophilus TaxID=361277 RepID=UPI000C99F4D7|nr:glycoside hydrolase [Terribacillus goriensis]
MMTRLAALLLIILCFFLLPDRFIEPPPIANSWLTTGDEQHLLEKQQAKLFQDDKQDKPTIYIDKDETYQQMEGFGAAMTGSSAYLLEHKLTTQERDTLFQDLFTDSGIQLSYLRHTIGASDYSVDDTGNPSSYTYADQQGTPEDPLQHFSIAPDQTVMNMLKQAKISNPELQLMGTPWTAPPWLKYGEPTYNGSYLNYTDQRTYEIYADYFIQYLKAYQEEGLPVDMLSVQNEPQFETAAYPSMSMGATEQQYFIQHFLGPAIQDADLETAILAYDHNWENSKDYAETVLNGVSDYTAGTAYHCYAGNPEDAEEIHQLHPDKGIYFTECSGGAWSENFGDNLSWLMDQVIIGTTRNWAKTVLLWNLALDETGGPTNGGCTNCRGVVTIDSQTSSIKKNVEYYALGHISKFVQPGAKRISSTQLPQIATVAFYDASKGETILLAANSGNSSQTFQLSEGKHYLQYTLPPQSAITFTWKDAA